MAGDAELDALLPSVASLLGPRGDTAAKLVIDDVAGAEACFDVRAFLAALKCADPRVDMLQEEAAAVHRGAGRGAATAIFIALWAARRCRAGARSMGTHPGVLCSAVCSAADALLGMRQLLEQPLDPLLRFCSGWRPLLRAPAGCAPEVRVAAQLAADAADALAARGLAVSRPSVHVSTAHGPLADAAVADGLLLSAKPPPKVQLAWHPPPPAARREVVALCVMSVSSLAATTQGDTLAQHRRSAHCFEGLGEAGAGAVSAALAACRSCGAEALFVGCVADDAWALWDACAAAGVLLAEVQLPEMGRVCAHFGVAPLFGPDEATPAAVQAASFRCTVCRLGSAGALAVAPLPSSPPLRAADPLDADLGVSVLLSAPSAVQLQRMQAAFQSQLGLAAAAAADAAVCPGAGAVECCFIARLRAAEATARRQREAAAQPPRPAEPADGAGAAHPVKEMRPRGTPSPASQERPAREEAEGDGLLLRELGAGWLADALTAALREILESRGRSAEEAGALLHAAVRECAAWAAERDKELLRAACISGGAAVVPPERMLLPRGPCCPSAELGDEAPAPRVVVADVAAWDSFSLRARAVRAGCELAAALLTTRVIAAP